MTKRRRRRGTGSIEPMPDGSFRPRLPDRGPRLAPCATYEEAERLLDAAIIEIVEGRAVAPGGDTLRSWGASWLDEREHDGYDIGSDRSRWRVHVETAYFVDWPLRSITQADIYGWLDTLKTRRASKGRGHKRTPKRKLARTTKQNTLNLLRCSFEDARRRGRVPSNPCDGVRLGRGREAVTHDPWTYLLPDEQKILLTCDKIPEANRLLIAFAIGTGLRQSEQWNLHLADLRMPPRHPEKWVAVVRYGSRRKDKRAASRRVKAKGGPTKGGQVRYVPIFGLAREALVRWLAILQTRPNRFGLVWPTTRGYRRQPGERPASGRSGSNERASTPPDATTRCQFAGMICGTPAVPPSSAAGGAGPGGWRRSRSCWATRTSPSPSGTRT